MRDNPATEAAQRAPVILIVDDEPAVLRMLEFVLKEYGLSVRTAGSGKLAVELYAREHCAIDAVVLDVQMPRMDGPETLAALHAIDPKVPCIFMTGNPGGYVTEQLLGLGAVAVVQKPFPSLPELIRVIREIVPVDPNPR